MPTSDISRVCVYCASSIGTNDRVVEATRTLGRLLAAEAIGLVYGGGSVGLMGLIADTVMEAGGEVTGIIPTGLFPLEVAHTGITNLIEVDSMHDRKAEMIRRSDAFIALPGGFGTLEELTEVLTWAQLGIHRKPVGLLNVDGFFDGLLRFFDRCVEDRVLKTKNLEMLLRHDEPAGLLETMRAYEPRVEKKWLGAEQI